MLTDLFDYELPEAAIASRPLPERDAGRLLSLEPHAVAHRMFREFPELLPANALVVLNDTRVIPARILGTKRATGGRVELLLLRRMTPAGNSERWTALGRASKGLARGSELQCGALRVVVAEKLDDGSLVVDVSAEPDVESALAAHGRVPIPPYMGRQDDADDVARYQTVFAAQPGSVAAPTAGLHFTPEVLARIEQRGIEVSAVTLHVGLGTFRPVTTLDLDDHPMHSEWYSIDADAARAINAARAADRPVVAIGTTVVRALESAGLGGRPLRAMAEETRLLIQPGQRFHVVDALLTNFHLPKSTLLALVAAFAGRERVLEAYSAALQRGYRFLSYGDAMWIPERAA